MTITQIQYLEDEIHRLQTTENSLNRQYNMAERILADGDVFGNTAIVLDELAIELDTISDIKGSLQKDLDELLLELGQQEAAERIRMKELYEKM